MEIQCSSGYTTEPASVGGHDFKVCSGAGPGPQRAEPSPSMFHQASCHTPVLAALGRWKQEDWEVRAFSVT